MPRWKWWFILNLFILPTRPQRSAAQYAASGIRSGSPLFHYTRRQAELLQEAIRGSVRFVRIGNPLGGVVKEMIVGGVDRLLILPMYPQYSTRRVRNGRFIQGLDGCVESRPCGSFPVLRSPRVSRRDGDGRARRIEAPDLGA